jgi:hypothetical protein
MPAPVFAADRQIEPVRQRVHSSLWHLALGSRVQQPCSNPSRTEPNTAGMRKPSIDRNRRI